MKKIHFISFLLFLFSCGGEGDHEGVSKDNGTDKDSSIVEFNLDASRVSAVEFNNELTLMQNDMLSIISALFQSDSSNARINHENALFEAQVNLSELDAMEFDGSETAFIKEMKNLMNFYITELGGEFKEIIPLLEKSVLSKEEKARLRKYDERFALDEKACFMKVFSEQDEFAEINNIELIEQQ